jgi:tRNA pseudouridine13 synthase
LFNAVVAARMTRGNWDKPMQGEVFGFADNGTILLPENQRGDEVARFEKGIVELTAPLWGSGELQSVGEVRRLEQEVLAGFFDITAGLEAFGLRQERRVMRLRPLDSTFEVMDSGDLKICFDLPKGTYATTLLSELADLDDTRQEGDVQPDVLTIH